MPNHSPLPNENRSWDRKEFVHRVGVVVLILALAAGAILILWLAFDVALLFFASVLLAIFLRNLANWVRTRTGWGMGWSLGAVMIGLGLLGGGIGWLIAAPISKEAVQVQDELPNAVAQLQRQLQSYSWGQALLHNFQPANLGAQAGNFLGKAKNVFSVTIETLIYAWVVLFCGVYLALDPEYYLQGFVSLLPIEKRSRARVVLQAISTELQGWLFGQILSMIIIGLLTWLGLVLLRVPAAAALGVLTGLLDFVPVAGPWVAGIVSCLLALLRSPMHALYVAILFIGLHLFEGQVLVPQIQKRATRLPPVLTILAMILFNALFGIMGLFLATPLLALVIVTVKSLYVEEVVENHRLLALPGDAHYADSRG